MKKTFQLVSRLLLCSMVVISLSGCGDDDKNDDKDEDPKPEIVDDNDTDDSPSSTVTIAGFVDLGLSVQWAQCNLGAENPEDYGDYYAWGETETKESFDQENSQWYNVSEDDLKSGGVIDEQGNLTASYDVATQKLGSTFRMPTKAEFQELKDDCTWTWTKQNDVSGYKIVGTNGNSIFFPASGYYSNTYLENSIAYGYYWTSTEEESDVSSKQMMFDQNLKTVIVNSRYYGLSVRAVAK